MSKELELLIRWKQRLIDLNFEESEKTKIQKNRDYYRGLHEKLTECIEQFSDLFNTSKFDEVKLLSSWKQTLHNLEFCEGPYADSSDYDCSELFYYKGLKHQLDICIYEFSGLLESIKFRNKENEILKLKEI